MEKKVYDLPLSRNYVHNWGVKEAIREIMQNAVDSDQDGNNMHVSYNNGTLEIGNFGCNIDISSLVLGNSDKNDAKYVGTYGEGYKLAILVLLREGLEVTVYTNGQEWKSNFRKSRKFKIETLHIDVYPNKATDNQVMFKIDGLDYDNFVDIRENSIAMLRAMKHSVGKVIPSDFGEILVDSQYKGKMFVNGLYISKDTSFKYGYNFNSDVVQLDRDRKAINYYRLRELTALAMTSQKDTLLVESAIRRRDIDVRDIVEYIDKVSDEFNVNFANDFMSRHNIDEETFVGTEKEIIVAKPVKSLKVTHKSIAEIVNRGQGKKEEYEQIKQKVKKLSKKEKAYEYYYGGGFENLVKFLTPKLDRFTEEEKDELKDILDNSDLHPSYFDSIRTEIITAMFTEEDEEEEAND